MALFTSTYINKIDRKGRVSVPAQFRSELSNQPFQGIIVFRSFKVPALECFSREQMEQLSARLGQFDLFSDEQDDLAATILGGSTPLAFDADGRISLPSGLAEHAGITEQAAFCGRGPTFQIWDPETLAKHQADARARVRSKGLTIPSKAPPQNNS